MTSSLTLDGQPAAPQATAPQWWKDAVIYQVYPRSFADSNGDGIGDLPGITAHLDTIAALGVDAIWLSPFYASPQNDAGYDVADYRAVDPRFGTLADADALLARARELGLKVLVDLVPNHSSDQHVWFQAALAAGPGSPERDRYVFREGRGPAGDLPPNNWRSIFGGSAWTRVSEHPDSARLGVADGQWYLNLFDSSQPDFNWDNEQVRSEFDDILRFWLERGVDGFRVDVAHGLVKAPGLPDWDGTVVMADASEDETDVARAPMFDQDGVHDIYRRWHRVLSEFSPERILVAEAWVEPLARLAKYVRPDEMHQAFNFSYLSVLWDPEQIREVIDQSLAAMAEVGATSTWVLSNHDVIRHVSRFGLDYDGARPNGVRASDPQPDPDRGVRRGLALTLQMLALPGSAYLYQGEELGLPEHTALDDSVREDPAFFRTAGAEAGRDGCRIPLPWRSDAPGLGFSPNGKTWLPQPEAYNHLAYDVQEADPASVLALYRHALATRRARLADAGDLRWLDATDGRPFDRPDVVAFERGGITVVTVFGSDAVDLQATRIIASSDPVAYASASRDGLVHGATLRVAPETTVWLERP